MFTPLETSDAELIPRTEAGLQYSSRSCSSLRKHWAQRPDFEIMRAWKPDFEIYEGVKASIFY
ncbi:hypothetical protein Taro_054625 [Colocasia esculenta]|uniref:Uncharacterized protein n=1 Tax=Colocasia esculenta TaxID=4460 RepID=A0A843XR21_COLES|nr:hypothetical protein [Colocasia esculenta]